MIKLSIEEAIGKPLAHDITRIVPGKSKGPAFRRGHVLAMDDLSLLKDMGKNNVYVFDTDKGYIHEDEAAKMLAGAFQKEGFSLEGPREGRINIKSRINGLLKIDLRLLKFINRSETVICSTIHQNTVCSRGMTVAATRIIPVAVEESGFLSLMREIRKKGPLLKIRPFSKKRVGVIATGEEIASGRIENISFKVLSPKIQSLGGKIVSQKICPDIKEEISDSIKDMHNNGCDVIIATGGLSVDADDVTLDGIVLSGAELVSYGSPILPGAMFALAYMDDVPILGIPAALYYYKATVLDIFLPRAMSGDTITRDDIVNLGHGGLCLNCPECNYPVCPFGKGF
ncbi:MAG: molybdopterin-binding protein [Thermodesulfobacteriota bacterium]|nr:molybdopterin-binding protein [Thermodesulfobacteriota bacterium]